MTERVTIVVGGLASLPVNTVAPVISGDPVVGEELSCTTGTWTGSPAPTFSYQWQRDGVDIGSATASTYTLVQADATFAIKCVVTATNTAGAVPADSNTIDPIYDADAWAWFSAVSWGASDLTQKAAFNQYFVDLKAGGVYTKLDRIRVYANRDVTAALTCLKSLQLATAVNSPTFTQWRGYQGNGSNQYINNNWAATDGVNWTRDAAAMFVDSRSNVQNPNQFDFGGRDGSSVGSIMNACTGLTIFFQVNTGTGAIPSNTDSRGLIIVQRNNSTTEEAFRDNVSLGTAAANSSPLVATDFFSLAYSQDGTPSLHSTRQLAMDGTMGLLTSGERGTFQTARDTLKTAIGW